MAEGQDWCLNCGKGVPGSLGTPGWRPAATIIGVALALVLGAAAAGYAALNSSSHKRRLIVATVPQASAPATPAPATTLPPATTAPLHIAIPPVTVKPPKIPLTVATPKAIKIAPLPSKPITPATTTPSTTTNGGSSGSAEPPVGAALVLDTNAASTYNPYNYPPANFGDPSLAIDGDTTTAWTAQVDPATAPKLAEGLLVDLKSAQRLASIVLITSSPGMTVQVYGADGKTVPASITDKPWVALSHSMVVKKRHTKIALKEASRAFRFVTLWISRAPASSIGTAQQPGHVSVNELELFPPR
jgi:hypothetical protein